MDNCHKYHEGMIETIKTGVNITLLDGDEDVYENPEVMERWKNTINEVVVKCINSQESKNFTKYVFKQSELF